LTDIDEFGLVSQCHRKSNKTRGHASNNLMVVTHDSILLQGVFFFLDNLKL